MAITQAKRDVVTSYGTTPVSVVNPDGSFMAKPVNDVYDNAEFNVSTGESDYDVDTNQSAAFSNITKATHTSIRTDNTISVKLNATTNASITIASADSPYVIDTCFVSNIYITNASGSTAAVKIFLT